MEYITSAKSIADLTVGIFRQGWLSSSQAAQLAGTDLAAFWLIHISMEFLSTNSPVKQETKVASIDALIEALKEIVNLRPTDEQASARLKTLLQERLDQKLKESGLLKEVKEPITDFAPYKDRTLMTVGSKPLSEIVIEGRR